MLHKVLKIFIESEYFHHNLYCFASVKIMFIWFNSKSLVNSYSHHECIIAHNHQTASLLQSAACSDVSTSDARGAIYLVNQTWCRPSPGS